MNSSFTYINPFPGNIVSQSAMICMPNAGNEHEALTSLREYVLRERMDRCQITALAKQQGVISRFAISLLVEAVIPITKPESRKKSKRAIVEL